MEFNKYVGNVGKINVKLLNGKLIAIVKCKEWVYKICLELQRGQEI